MMGLRVICQSRSAATLKRGPKYLPKCGLSRTYLTHSAALLGPHESNQTVATVQQILANLCGYGSVISVPTMIKLQISMYR